MGETVAAIVGGAALDGLNSYIRYQSSRDIASQQLGAQAVENSKNRDWQTEQAEIARSYNTAEREATQRWSERMIQEQNEYNSPVQQSLRLRSAGLNPAIALGSNGVSSVSASPQSSSPGTSPMPSGVNGLSPVSQQPLDLQIPQLMNGIGSFFKNMADAQKTGLDTDILTKTANSIIQSAAADAQYKQVAADFLKIDKDIKENVKDAEISSKWQELGILQGRLLITNSEAARQDLVSQLMKSEKELNEILSRKNGAEFGLVMLEIASFNKKLNSLINLQRSEANSANADARSKRASAAFQEFENKMRDKFSPQVYTSYVNKLVSDGLLSKADGEEAKRRLRIIENVTGGTTFVRKLDESLEWIKGKMSIFH